MKKILTILFIGLLLCSCGRYKELNKEEKFKLLYEAEVLHKKEARKEVKKIYEKINKYIEKKDEDAIKEKEEYNKIVNFFKGQVIMYGIFLDGIKYPSTKEVMGKDGEIINTQFRLYHDSGKYYDYITDKLYTGLGTLRNWNGEIQKVIKFENGEIKDLIQNNSFDMNGNLLEEVYYENGDIIAVRKYNEKREIKEERYILERYKNGGVKKDYLVVNGNKKGKLREFNKNNVVIKEEEK